jgi:glucosamine--fructose-6-phosphate aminotransferase (isomerizing)
MCGIFGAINQSQDVIPHAIKALSRLEYRGYDSAGLAFFEKNTIKRIRQVGDVAVLASAISKRKPKANIAVGHTRWATHGTVCEENAHPHFSYNRKLAGVHNGIIENAKVLKDTLIKAGISLLSETDSEIAISYIAYLAEKQSLTQALLHAQNTLVGSYAIALLSKDDPEKIYVLTGDRQIAVGQYQDGYLFASDEYALLPFCQNIAYPDSHEIMVFESGGFDCLIKRPPIFKAIKKEEETQIKNNFMIKEIQEQPQIFARQSVMTNELPPLNGIQSLHFVACGTSFHAALVAKYWFLAHTNFHITVEHASEYRYISRQPIANTAIVVLSQSGETADTLSALRYAKTRGMQSIALCNVPTSSIAREADFLITLDAGREFGVASTKAFTSQLVRLAQLLAHISTFPQINFSSLITASKQAISKIADIKPIAKELVQHQNALFIGRLSGYPLAMEAALKLKEITYIHAEAYPAGELKHGPIALIDANMPTIALVSQFHQPEKTLSNIEEIKSRSGKVFVFSDMPIDHAIHLENIENEFDFAVASTILLQQLAYEACTLKQLNPDKPRNLAKSVTVE